MKTFLKYFLVFLASLVVNILFTPLRGAFMRNGPFEGIPMSPFYFLLAYFFLTLFFLKKYDGQLKLWGIILLIFLGATHYELIHRITHFYTTLGSFLEFLIRIFAILAGLFVYIIKEKKLKIGIGILLLGVGIWLSIPGYRMWINKLEVNETYLKKTERNHIIPEFVFENSHNETINIADFRGQFVLLYFWDSSCESCFQDFAEIQKMHEDYADSKELRVIPVFCKQTDREGTIEEGMEIIRKKGFSFETLSIEVNDPVLSSYDIDKLPVTLILNRENQEVFKGTINEARKKWNAFSNYRKNK